MDNNHSFLIALIALLFGIGIGILLPGVVESMFHNGEVLYLRLK